MESTLLKELLDAGARHVGDRPDDLVRRSLVASVLCKAGLFVDVADALRAFRLWTNPEVRAACTPEQFIARYRPSVD